MPTPIKLGYHCPLNSDTARPGRCSPNRTAYSGCMVLNGAGKSTRFLIELLATASNRSLLVFDIKGELAWQTAHMRHRYSDVFFDQSASHAPPAVARLQPGAPSIPPIPGSSATLPTSARRQSTSPKRTSTGMNPRKACSRGFAVRNDDGATRKTPALAWQCAPHAERAGRNRGHRDVSGRRQERLKGGITFTAQQILQSATIRRSRASSAALCASTA